MDEPSANMSVSSWSSSTANSSKNALLTFDPSAEKEQEGIDDPMGERQLTDQCRRISSILAYAFFLLGIVGSLLILITIGRYRSSFHASLRRLALAMAVLDAAYLMLKLVEFYRLSVTESFLAVNAGLLGFCSLLSDLFFLMLIAERCCGFMLPVVLTVTDPCTIRVVWALTVLGGFLTAATRFHYILAYYSETLDNYGRQSWLLTTAYFSDAVLPALLSVLSVFFIIVILRQVHCRRRANQIRCADSSYFDERLRDLFLVYPLLLLLLIVCLTNQAGFVAYHFSESAYRSMAREHSDGSDRTSEIYRAYRSYVIVSNVSANLELFARSVVFYLYVGLSQLFRGRFCHLILSCKAYCLRRPRPK